MLFQDRSDAGHQLAKKLQTYHLENPIILALARGGVPVGYEIALALNAALNVLVIRKVGAPLNPEFGVGAVASGIEILNIDSLHMLGLTASEIQNVIKREQQEVERQNQLYQQKDLLPIKGRTVILVDDGIATGITVRAALQAIEKLKPLKTLLAIPVGPLDTLQELTSLVDELICLKRLSPFYAVGSSYLSFPQVSDEEVIRLLKDAKRKKKDQ